MEDTIKRKTAKRILIKDILTSTYIKRPGWEPSGILTKYGEISRVDLMGIVVSITEEGSNFAFLIDDSSGNISIRFFEKPKDFEKFSIGDLIKVIGRPREWESSKYIVPEIIKKIEDKRWYKVHQLEIKLQKKTESIKLPVEAQEENQDIETGPYQKILNVIAILDKGNGADIQEIVNHVKVEGCEEILNSLIEEGEVFEISPGKVKLLE